METTPNENDRLATKQDMLLLKEDLSRLGDRMDQLFKNQLRWLVILIVGWSSLLVIAMKLL
ncbi:hypothetical protein GGD38_002911 [Chitinophagaceae bacterium OAS944]|nr:hypothetical protein [Chitinophagaceae bacterium OAS944]